MPLAGGPGLLPPGGVESPCYVVIMVADDGSETDGDPLHHDDDNDDASLLDHEAEALNDG